MSDKANPYLIARTHQAYSEIVTQALYQILGVLEQKTGEKYNASSCEHGAMWGKCNLCPKIPTKDRIYWQIKRRGYI